MKVTTITATVSLLAPLVIDKKDAAITAQVNSLAITAALGPGDSAATAAVKLKEEIRAAMAAILPEGT